MSQIVVTETGLEGLLIVDPFIHMDDRGFFLEAYNRREFVSAGITDVFVQDNQSRSRKGVLRGMHYQKHHPQGKLVSVTHGEVYDVVLDLRRESPTFMKWYGVLLSGENHRQMYVPRGFAHGYVVLSEYADFHYKTTDYYEPGDEGGIRWYDSAMGIEWPVLEKTGDDGTPAFFLEDGTKIITSEKDECWPYLKDAFLFD